MLKPLIYFVGAVLFWKLAFWHERNRTRHNIRLSNLKAWRSEHRWRPSVN